MKLFAVLFCGVLSKGVTMRMYGWLAVAALFVLATPVLGQQGAGDTELQMQGSVSVNGSMDHKTSGTIMVNPGRFLTDLQEVGLGLDGNINGGKLTGSVSPFYRFNFSTSKIVPYLGLTVGTQFGNVEGGRSTLASAEAGIRFFVDSKTAFTVDTSKSYFFKQKQFDHGLTIAFGFSHLWGK
jgi:hypothetical protein